MPPDHDGAPGHAGTSGHAGVEQTSAESYFYQLDEHRFRPLRPSQGPWSPEACHGGPPSALAIHEIEGHQPDRHRRLAQVHIDFYGEVPLAPLTFTTTTLRNGRRIQLIETVGRTDDHRAVIAARGWRLAVEPDRNPHVEGPLAIPDYESGHPDDAMASFPYGASINWSFLEGHFAKPGPATVWAHPGLNLLNKTPLTPVEAALLVADSANGISSELDFADFVFIPTVIEVVFRSRPTTTEIGLSARTTIDREGVGVTRGTLFDRDHAYGYLLQTLYVEPRNPAS
ncbi:MAG: thioesterase family protein [Ferrimicrobium sp.]|jgi:hypothetical protein|nr:thioesterase family protein [Ferrimicrobium sp.]